MLIKMKAYAIYEYKGMAKYIIMLLRWTKYLIYVLCNR